MKRKKILSLAAAAALMLSAILPAQAATSSTLAANGSQIVTTSETVTISQIPDDAAGLSFDTYQVLYANYDETSNALTYHLTDWATAALNVGGTGSAYASESAAIKAIAALTGTSGTGITGQSGGNTATEQNDIVNALAAYIAQNGSVAAVTSSKWSTNWLYSSGNTEATLDLPVGAYLVIPNASNMAFLNMLVSVDAVASGSNNKWETSAHGAVLKGNKIDLTKVVEEKGANETADGSTDVRIGGTVTYTVTADVPRFASNADNIKFEIVDVPTNVKIDTTTLQVYGVNASGNTQLDESTNYTFSYNYTSTENKLTIDFSSQYGASFRNLETNGTYTYPYTSVKITYDAELLSTAAINSANTNTVTLTYGHDGTSNTAAKTANVYTYKVKVTKKGEGTANLSGASFEISLGGTPITFVAVSGSNGTYRVADSDDTGASETVTTGSEGTLTLLGLDSGKTYMMKETVAPSGYSINTNVVYFTLTAPSTLSGTVADVTSKEYTDSSKTEEVTANKSWSVSLASDSTGAELSLTDTKIPALPATGSVGIIVFTVVGVAIMILALVLIHSGKSREKKA
ncbi:MAG: isopeptide-forming domain-containing fimbrial protein [Lachnospiraceae bacterium]|nr:isopeptide-forming domain-containing fimbrial protein [Lachnospiraceae bacterium]